MMREANEIYEKHFVLDNTEIFFKRNDQNKTLSAYLRDESLSALVFDVNRNVIGTYGVYAGLIEQENQENLAKKADLDKAVLEGQTHFAYYQLHENKSHLVLFYPIISNTEIYGALVLSSDLNFGPSAMWIVFGVLLAILTISIGCGWVFTYWTVSRQFRPLLRILNEMNNYELGKTPTEYELVGNPNDELVRLSKAFKLMMNRIHEGSKKQTEFIANSSHELKTPLANSLLTLELAEMDIVDKKYLKAKESIRTVKSDLKRYGETLDSLLELAKVNLLQERKQKINVSTILNEIILQHIDTADKKLEIKIDEDYKMSFPENHFRIILNNLISNAIKYTNSQGLIKIEIRRQNKGEVVVENETTHIKTGDLEKIWKRHERLGFFKKVSGNGIGLYLVKEIADYYGLTISQGFKNGKFKIVVSGFEG